MVWRRCLLIFSVFMACSTGFAEMHFVYHGPESEHDSRYRYHWEILKTALDLTTKKYGPFTLTVSEFMSEAQQLAEMKKNSPKLTVMIRETNLHYEKFLIPVRIPIDKNLIGYRILLIEKKDQPQLAKVKTLEDLRKFTVGQGEDWGDIEILEHSGFKVKTEYHYDDLFKSLSEGKFKIFPRGVVEILDEYRKFKGRYPNLAIESTLLLYYPLPTYFWFQDNKNGRLMAERVEEGMKLLIESGGYQKIFDKHYAKVIRELNLDHRTIISIPNPNLPITVPFDKKELWYNPPE
ncbi:MAG: hypothetical protein ACM3MG_14045 [Bacillota bacterium]